MVGANKTDYHIKNVNLSDFKVTKFTDLRNITQDDLCPKCRSQKVTIERGIEVGHIFKLGTKYTQAFNCVYTDEKGEKKLMIMGCYGIGINRTAAAIIEQMHDEDGIIWPITVAPYEVIIVPVNVKDENQKKIAFEIYENLQRNGVEVLIDDRDERAGVKFKDADLIGIPFRVTVGKKISEGKLEIRNRRTKESFEVEIEKAIEVVINLIREEKAKYQI